jgi:beta-glucosidase/6-phospho-beta-glucosidase/beta-galactosidase
MRCIAGVCRALLLWPDSAWHWVQPTIHNGDRCGTSSDFWNRYEEDLERARSLGSNCFRLSLEWHRIEPARGQIDMEAVQRYNDMFDCMERCAATARSSK